VGRKASQTRCYEASRAHSWAHSLTVFPNPFAVNANTARPADSTSLRLLFDGGFGADRPILESHRGTSLGTCLLEERREGDHDTFDELVHLHKITQTHLDSILPASELDLQRSRLWIDNNVVLY